MWLVFLIHPNNMNLIHRGRPGVNVSVKCLVLVKIYGNSPKKSFIKIIRNGYVRISLIYFYIWEEQSQESFGQKTGWVSRARLDAFDNIKTPSLGESNPITLSPGL
jgi:hypothetical protein